MLYSAIIINRLFRFVIWENIIITCKHGKYGVIFGIGIETNTKCLEIRKPSCLSERNMIKSKGDKFCFYKKRKISFIDILKLLIPLCIEIPKFQFYPRQFRKFSNNYTQNSAKQCCLTFFMNSALNVA